MVLLNAPASSVAARRLLFPLENPRFDVILLVNA
jgi:hypothetical protein